MHWKNIAEIKILQDFSKFLDVIISNRLIEKLFANKTYANYLLILVV